MIMELPARLKPVLHQCVAETGADGVEAGAIQQSDLDLTKHAIENSVRHGETLYIGGLDDMQLFVMQACWEVGMEGNPKCPEADYYAVLTAIKNAAPGDMAPATE